MATALNEHIVTSYEDELINLNKAISEMGGMVEQAITEAANALLKLDHVRAQNVRQYDKQIDAMKNRINDAVISIIARRQPMAADLRLVVTAMQVATDLERTGDMAKQLAKRTLQIEKPRAGAEVLQRRQAHDRSGGTPAQARPRCLFDARQQEGHRCVRA